MVAESKAARYAAFASRNTRRARRSVVLPRGLRVPPVRVSSSAGIFVSSSPGLSGLRVGIDPVLAQVVRQVALVDPQEARRFLAHPPGGPPGPADRAHFSPGPE